MPLVAGPAALTALAWWLSGELSGRPSPGRLNWLASDSSMLSSVVTALLPL